MNDRIAAKEYYSIGEVCGITDLKPHVLRYWESQFPVLKPTKNAAGNRVYRRRDDQARPAPAGTSSTARSTRSREPVRSWISCASRASWRRPLAWPWSRRPYATCAGKWIRWSRCSARFDLAPGLAAGGRHRRGGAPPAVPLYERRRVSSPRDSACLGQAAATLGTVTSVAPDRRARAPRVTR